MKRALVTGGSGFVGSNLIRRLLQDGHEVHLLLRPEHEPWRLAGLSGVAQTHWVNLEDHEAIERVLTSVRPEWVFHLAAYGAYSTQIGLRPMVETNLLASAALIRASERAGVQTFIQTGSSSEYGYKDHPAEETELLQPNSDYAITKAAATHYCQVASRTLDLNAVTVRLYSVYGPYEDPNRLIPTLIIHGFRGRLPPLVSPSTARDFIFTDDAVEAMLHIASGPSIPRGSVYNVCTGVQSTLADVVEIVRKRLQIGDQPNWSTMHARSWDTDRWVGSPIRTAHEIGWRSAITLQAGIERTIEWFEAHPEVRELYEKRIFAA